MIGFGGILNELAHTNQNNRLLVNAQKILAIIINFCHLFNTLTYLNESNLRDHVEQVLTSIL